MAVKKMSPALRRRHLLFCAAYRLFQFCAELFQRPLFDSGNVAPADAEGGRDFPLRQRNRSAKAVPQTNDFRLPPGEALIHQLPQAQGAVPVVEILQHGVVYADDVHELQRVAVPVGFNGLRKGNLSLQLLLAAEVHQDFIRYPLLTDT